MFDDDGLVDFVVVVAFIVVCTVAAWMLQYDGVFCCGGLSRIKNMFLPIFVTLIFYRNTFKASTDLQSTLFISRISRFKVVGMLYSLSS